MNHNPAPAVFCQPHDTRKTKSRQTPQQLDLLAYGQHAKQTRAIAAAAAKPKAPKRRDQIAAYVASCGHRGATRQEIADALELPIQSVCGPVLAMLRNERLTETDKRRLTSNGKPAAVIVDPQMGAA